MKTANEMTPTILFHPGTVVEEEISYRGLTVKEVASKMQMPVAGLSEIIRGKKNISTLIAIKLEEALGINALFFLNMQSRYDYFSLKKKLSGRTTSMRAYRKRAKVLR